MISLNGGVKARKMVGCDHRAHRVARWSTPTSGRKRSSGIVPYRVRHARVFY